ncbi:fungal-specific transcription factor domain-containing protein [Gymnopilus junonius]|uniref:Fungal-specific transcription factor domain-containing protein n=1 Tax=Gymnopilus junonius TaxID=109634 RepID=A0A9P5TQS6_GYMJU|nr:fungal-specific transcription factor domain-containing protein [Gymnopilus junonius]
MAYRSHTASPAGSSSSSSTNASPYINTTPLDNMVPTDDGDSSYSAHGTPNHSTTSLPRTLNAGKGGCWTCRVRRKKCDEQREGDSCKTCKRLMIKCLGWGAKRPDWMRDKKMVDAYKASIKAQLSRAGLIRGQPRHNPMQMHSQRGMQQIRPPTLHTASAHNTRSTLESLHHTVEPSFIQNHTANHLVSGMPTPITPFDDFSGTFDNFDQSANVFWSQPALFNPSVGADFLGNDFLNPPTNESLFAEQSMISPHQVQSGHEELVMHYFNNVQKVQPFFAGEALRDATYAAILDEPRGAVTLAICALADLHIKQTRIDKGLEAPNPSFENSTTYYRNEAMFQLGNNKTTHGRYSDNDAIAALHLIGLSQLSGGVSDWDAPFDILCQWLLQTNLHVAENTWITFLSLTPTVQLYVKAILWLDVFSSLSVLRPPKFLLLWKSLLGEFWNGSEMEMPHRLRMDAVTGCPDEAMLAIAEVSALAHWKAAQLRNNCLSYPELIRRGTNIEQQLRGSQNYSISVDATRVHGTASAQLSEEQRSLIANIFRETAHLYLHTVLSNSTPGVPEISASVQNLVRFFSQLPPSEQDRTLMFPICLAGSMTNDSTVRNFFKERIRALNENYGNLLQTRRLMEEVWQKRDAQGREVDLRETIREQGLKILLV